MNNKTQSFSTLLIILAGVFWGSSGLFVRKLNALGISTIEVCELRLGLAAVFYLLIMLFRDRSAFRVEKRSIPVLLALGLASVLCFSVCYFKSIELLPMSVAAILLYTSPIWVALMSVIFFKEKLSAKMLTALVLAFGGCILVSGTGRGELNPLGIMLGLCAGITYGLYSIIGTVALRHCKPLTVTAYSISIAALGLLAIFGVSGITRIFTDRSLLPHMPIFLALALVTNVIPYLCYTKGLQSIPASKAAILATVEPLMATVFGTLILSEPMTVSAAIGISAILLAIVVLNMRGKFTE